MATAGDVITASLRKAGVIRETQNPTAEQYRDALDTFNEMMSEMDGDGINVGDYPVSAVEDVLAVDRQHLGAVKILFAVHLAADHGLPVDNTLAALAPVKYEYLLRNTKSRPIVTMSHVPTGRARAWYDINNG